MSTKMMPRVVMRTIMGNTMALTTYTRSVALSTVMLIMLMTVMAMEGGNEDDDSNADDDDGDDDARL